MNLGGFGGVLLAASWLSTAAPQSPTTAIPPAFDGVFQSVSNETRVAGGLRNIGSPEDLVLLPAAVQPQKAFAQQEDPERKCEPIGPFRMIAREGVRLELVPVPASNT